MRRRVPVANDAFAHGEVDHDPAASRAWITRRAGSRSRRKVDPSYPAAEVERLPESLRALFEGSGPLAILTKAMRWLSPLTTTSCQSGRTAFTREG